MTTPTTPPYRDPALPLEQRVEDLLARMTLAEKVGQMLQLNGREDYQRELREMQPGSLLHILNDRLSEAMDLAAESRLQIPLLIGEDGIHGHSFHPGATIFPNQLGLACSWDTELIEQVARVTAREMATTGAHWTFSPVLCLARDLRWGRVDETFGEDPFLIGEFGVAMIRGYQGRGLDDTEAVLACAKHYAGYSETQGGRDASEADISRRKLRSYFLPPFERAARAGCMTFMTGYQSMDGLPSTANRWLLTEVLKEEWGFQGILVTDWDNVGRLCWEQRIAPTPKEAAVIAIRCGNDLVMTTPDFFQAAQAAVREGLVDESEIDVIVRRILALKFRMGLFENPRRPNRVAQAQVIASAAHREVNLRAARESIVLLQNDGILPLNLGALKRLAVIGPNADNDLAQLGDWSLGASQYPPAYGKHPRECTVTVLDGIRSHAPSTLAVEYARGCSVTSSDTSEIPAAVELATRSDVCIVVIGDDLEFNGETRSTATLELCGAQRELLAALVKTQRPLVIVLVNGKPLVIPELLDRASAIVECFNPGMLGGTALAEILFGKQNPSGKLTISFPRHVGQQPVFYNQVPGQHGSRYADLTQEPRFAFGYGLSYTRYVYSAPRLLTPQVRSGQAVEVEVEITNAGTRDGVEIAQAYLFDLVTSVTWVTKKLVAFARVELRAGERRSVRFSIPHTALALVDAFERTLVEPGEFEIGIGPSSRDQDLVRLGFVVEGEAFSFERIPGVARPKAS